MKREDRSDHPHKYGKLTPVFAKAKPTRGAAILLEAMRSRLPRPLQIIAMLLTLHIVPSMAAPIEKR